MLIERRKNPRFCVRDNAFAVFGPGPVKLVPIIDISLGGLGIGVNGINSIKLPAKKILRIPARPPGVSDPPCN